MSRQFAVLLVAGAGAWLSACGGGEAESGVPTDDPEGMVVAHFEALADCGEDAARRLIESSTASTSGTDNDETVAQILEAQEEEGCTPQPTGEIETLVTSESGDVVTVEARVPQGPDSGTHELRVVQTDEGWKVDADSEVPAG